MALITKQSLAFAIYSLVFQQLLLSDQVNALPADTDDDHMSDTILDLERCIGELRDLYHDYEDELTEADSFDVLYAKAERDYHAYAAQRAAGAAG